MPSPAPMKRFFAILAPVLLAIACHGTSGEEEYFPKKAIVVSVYLGNEQLTLTSPRSGISPDVNECRITFSKPVDLSRFNPGKMRLSEGSYSVSSGPNEYSVILKFSDKFSHFNTYSLVLDEGENLGLLLDEQYVYVFTTCYDPSEKFPRISTEELLTLVQQKTFAYFWDYAHPTSGLTRERKGSDDTVTSGGSGFGLMAIIAAVERGFISREDAYARLLKIVNFLSEKAERFHGAFSHWLNGSSGAAIAFSTYDNGADLVETSFLMEGLLACRNYFSDPAEAELREKITALWEAVEWDWFLRDGKLYWHWSPNYDWKMNMAVSGWNEALITYVLAASSPTHPISKADYTGGWAKNGGIRNGKKFYGITLPLGSDYGGPLFFAHYSFMGLDPRGLSDQYADYWEQNVAHSRINQAYCAANPKNQAGYSASCWGLTASDIPSGYTASSPTNDNGVIAPTAALSSMPYTPEESIAAMEYFYYILGDRLFGQYGFHDAFSLGARWIASSYIAIDQGPIVVMIENYRSGAIWNAFMADPDVTTGLAKLGFTKE